MTQQEATEIQETISIMETPKLTKRFATYFVAVLVGAYMFGRIVGGENAAFYFCMIAPIVWIVSAFVYQSKLKAGNNREAYDDMEAEMHTAKSQLTQSIVMIRKMQSEAKGLQEKAKEVQAQASAMQSQSEHASSEIERLRGVERSLLKDKQTLLAEIANATQDVVNAQKEKVNALAIAEKQKANALRELAESHAHHLEFAKHWLNYRHSRAHGIDLAIWKEAGETAKGKMEEYYKANTPTEPIKTATV